MASLTWLENAPREFTSRVIKRNVRFLSSLALSPAAAAATWRTMGDGATGQG